MSCTISYTGHPGAAARRVREGRRAPGANSSNNDYGNDNNRNNQ